MRSCHRFGRGLSLPFTLPFTAPFRGVRPGTGFRLGSASLGQLASWASVIVAASLVSVGGAGCAAHDGDDRSNEGADVTGGSAETESPVVFMFDGEAKDAAPACIGAMLSPKFAVTAKSCAKKDRLVGRALDKDGRGVRAKIKAVHAPAAADAEIAIVELDTALKGNNALVTHMPLRDGYRVNAFAAIDGKWLWSPAQNEASAITGAMVEETDSHGFLRPEEGTEICDGDMGAPVCSSVGTKIAGQNLSGTCGLSGLVVARITEAAARPAAAKKGDGAKAEPSPSPTAKNCSAGAVKVVQLGRYKEFLSKYAPEAFEPFRYEIPILRDYPYVPDGLWGYETKGEVKSCALESVKLAPLAPGAKSQKLMASASFAGMDKRATAWGRFGIAPKSAPTKFRWLSARALSALEGTAFDAKFEGIVGAEEVGEYIIAFRATANGGETWTQCDTDGIANGFSPEKAIELKVVDANNPKAPETPKAEEPKPSTTPPAYADPPAAPSDAPPGAKGGSGASSPRSPGSTSAPFEPKGEDSGGCSVSTGAGSFGASSSLSVGGVLFGLVALLRRRRAPR